MRSILLPVLTILVAAGLSAQSGILYTPDNNFIPAMTRSSDGNLVYFAQGRLTKITVEGELLWETDLLIDPLSGNTLQHSSDKEIFEQADGDLIMFGQFSVLRTTADGDIVLLEAIEGANEGVIAVGRDAYGFQVLAQNATPPGGVDEVFTYIAFDNALETRFSYTYPHDNIIGCSSMNIVDDKCMIYLRGEYAAPFVSGFEETLQFDTTGTIDFDIVADMPANYPEAVGRNGILYKAILSDAGFTMQAFDKDFELLGSSTITQEAFIIDSLLIMETMPDGNLIMVYNYFEYDGPDLVATTKFEFFSPTGEHLGSSAEFLRDGTNIYVPSDIVVLSDDLIALSGGVYFYASAETYGCIIFVDTAGIVNGVYYTGTVFHDINDNNMWDSGEERVPYPKIANDALPTYIVGDETGNYSMFLATGGETTTDWLNIPYWDLSDPETYDYFIDPGMFGSTYNNQHFRIDYSTEVTDLEISMNEVFIEIPFVEDDTLGRKITLTVTNVGNQVEEDATVELNYMEYFDITAIDPPPSFTTGTTIYWNIATLPPFISKSFTVEYQITFDPDLLGTMVNITGTVTSDATDVYPPNNHCDYEQPYEYSFDPNNKTVYPQGEGPTGNIPDETEWLQYTINFQNTGTANAHNVRLIDTLDTDLDPSSIYVLHTSDEMIMTNIAPSVYEWYFPNINLTPMEENYNESYGSISYKVKLDPGLPIGTVIENTAAIYFDLNEPVITNTTINTLALFESINDITSERSILIYPNPAGDVIYISDTEHDMSNTIVHVYDLIGNLVISGNMNSEQELNISSLPSGMYTIECQGSRGRFVKE